ncbi:MULTISPECIES: elongation factor P [Modestobacter]|uniref:Elongation factor P n=1 Tax=Modestobacter roseus TaxID=1181884 RepID=A0A562IP73_9ACTN|nr:elongation factor P [Modestobacter roseus]MQA34183.1 elongation factor P [Modestobacter roseus]TWH72503.1 elongation factor P [Modestobacter roseus]
MATTNDLKNGIVLNLDGQLWTVTDFQHVKPGKGGAFVRTTLKNVLSGKVVDKTFNAGTKVETANVDKRSMTFLYKEGTDFVFMDGDTFEQIYVPEATVGGGADYLLDNTEVTVAVHDDTPLYVELPVTMELVVQHTDPGLQGDRSTGGTKPATLETGAEIQVPLFITTGEKLKVDTRDGRYLGRVS